MEEKAAGRNQKGGKNRNKEKKSLDERLKSVMDKSAKTKGTPEAAEKMPKLEAREKKIRAKIAEGAK